jgi:hypothetical protein
MSRPPPSDRASRSLVPRPSSGPPARYQPFIQLPATHLTVTLAGQTITSADQLAEYLDGLAPAQVPFAIRDIQNQVLANAEYLQDFGAGVWELAETYASMQARRAQDAAAYEQEFATLIRAHQQSASRRDRLQEGHDRLTRTWMTSSFFNTVVLTQTTGSTAVIDALSAASAHGSPGQIFARASSFRLQRLAGIGPYRYRSADLTITPADIANAADQTEPSSIRPQQEQAAATQHNLVADQRGIHWIGGVPPPNVDDAYQHAGRYPALPAGPRSPVQTLPSSSAAPPFPSSPPPAQSPRPGTPQSPQTGAVTPSIQQSVELDPSRTTMTLRAQSPQTYAGMQGKGPPAKRRRDPASPQPQPPTRAQSEPAFRVKVSKPDAGPRPTEILDLISGLRTLAVSPTRSPLNRSKVRPVKIPVPQPTPLDTAIWGHVLRKAQAVAEQRQPPQLTPQQEQAIAGAVNSLPNLQASIQRLTAGVQSTLRADDDSLRAYLEGLADGSSVAFAAYNHDRHTVGGVREVAARLHRAFDGGPARIGDGNEYNQGFTVTPADFDTLIRDERHSGWLNSAVLMAALLGIARAGPGNEPAFVLHIDQVLQYRQRHIPAGQVRMPPRARNLVIPFHWGNHWTVGLVNVATRQIQHMDSHHATNRHRDAIAIMQQLLSDRSDVYGAGAWTVDTTRSGQQANSDDCGLWVIENARRLIDDLDDVAPVGPATRRFIADELYIHLINDTPPLTQQTQREADVARARQVAANAAGPGRSRSQPWSIHSTPTPGPDMPHIPNATIQPPRPSPPPTGAPGPGPRSRQGSRSSSQSSGRGRLFDGC